MVIQQTPSTKFTPLQHEMLNLFALNTSDEDLLAIKDLISRYYLDKFQKNISNAAWEAGYRTHQDFDALLNDPNQ